MIHFKFPFLYLKEQKVLGSNLEMINENVPQAKRETAC